LREDIIKGYDDRVVEDLKLVLDEGSSPLYVINSCLVPSIIDVGIMWNAGDYYLPDVILSVEAFKAASASLEELLKSQKERTIGRVVIGVVEGDAHDLGKDIVAAMLTSTGFEVRDLGINVTTETFLSAVRESRPNILALGAYMSSHRIPDRRGNEDTERYHATSGSESHGRRYTHYTTDRQANGRRWLRGGCLGGGSLGQDACWG